MFSGALVKTCVGGSWESSHRVGSFEYPQHVIFFARYEKLSHIMDVFLCIGLDMCFGSSLESSHPDGSFEYAQHVIFIAR